jgi:hypothetical protein
LKTLFRKYASRRNPPDWFGKTRASFERIAGAARDAGGARAQIYVDPAGPSSLAETAAGVGKK